MFDVLPKTTDTVTKNKLTKSSLEEMKKMPQQKTPK